MMISGSQAYCFWSALVLCTAAMVR